MNISKLIGYKIKWIEKRSVIAPALISIIIRSSDRDTLNQALESINKQTYQFIEVVVVNAKGSGHRAVPVSCGEKAVRFIDSPLPLRRSIAANLGLKHAQGAWILFLDDDDYIAPTHLASLLEAANQANSKVAYSHCQVVDESGRALPRRFTESFDRIKLLAGNFLPIHTVLFARTWYHGGGCRFDQSLDRFEDWDFWLQIAMRTNFLEVPMLTAFYRVHAGAGFGVHAPPDEIQQYALRFAAKWRERITTQDFLALMDLARRHRYLEI